MRTVNLVGSVSRKAGGLHESVRRLVQSLDAGGVGVQVLSLLDEFTEADVGSWRPVPVKLFPASWPRTFGYSPGFLREMASSKPDLVHTHGIWMYPSIATTVYCHRQKVPYMISAHGMLDPWAVKHGRWKKVLAYAIYEGNHVRGARCLRALCESEAVSIRLLGLTNPIAIIPNGIDLPDPRPATSEVQPPPWAAHLERGKQVLLYLGRIHPKKGLPNLLRAWAATLNHQPSTINDWVLAIAGWDQGGHETELKRLATELGIQWTDLREQKSDAKSPPSALRPPPAGLSSPLSVIFLGPQFGSGKEACYRNCAGFILPSFSEGVPMVVLEAWAYRKPVLMTPECNLPVGFQREAAIRIETSQNEIIAGLQGFFAMTSTQRAALGDRGYELVCEQYTWNGLAAKVAATYEWMAGDGPAPAWVHQQ